MSVDAMELSMYALAMVMSLSSKYLRSCVSVLSSMESIAWLSLFSENDDPCKRCCLMNISTSSS